MSVTLYPWSATACFRISLETSLDGFASGGKGISLLIGSNLNEWTSVPLLAKSAEEKARLEKLSETEILAETQKCIPGKGALQRTFHRYNDSPSNSQNNYGKS